MDHSKHTRLSAMELTPAALEGATIYGANDDRVGKVSLIHGTGPGSQAIIEIGGFLGIGTKPVAVAASELEFMRDERGAVHGVTRWTKDELKMMPRHRY
ncbi:PRC-barrel domain containing protein [Devosia sp. A449]